MESKVNYTLVGLAVLILTAGLLFFSLWLSVGFDQKKYNTYLVYIPEVISGLSDSSLVKYNGVTVGYISRIELNKVNPQEVKLTLQIEEGTPVTTSTQATLIAQGITGATFLGLSATSSTFTPLPPSNGSPYPIIPYQPSFMHRLEKNIDSLSESFQRILSDENAKNITKSLRDLPALLKAVNNSTQTFNIMAQSMSTAGTQVTHTMNAAKAGMDKITQQTLPPLDMLLNRLDAIAANLEKTSTDIRQNPAIIIRGTAPPHPGPGE